jgi:hypothetical protein
MPTAQELEAAEMQAQVLVLAEHLLSVLNGNDTALAVIALIQALGDVAEQLPVSMRPVIPHHLRALADQMDAVDATKH